MRLRTLAIFLICFATAAPAQDDAASLRLRAEEAGIGGIGLAPCREMQGARNAPMLAQAGDWLLGYMAGRIDAGETLVEGEPLSAASSIDIVTSIASFCGTNPDATVLAAARRYAARVFGTEPIQRGFETAPPAARRPLPRPIDLSRVDD